MLTSLRQFFAIKRQLVSSIRAVACRCLTIKQHMLLAHLHSLSPVPAAWARNLFFPISTALSFTTGCAAAELATGCDQDVV
jgi:hypothetical protein